MIHLGLRDPVAASRAVSRFAACLEGALRDFAETEARKYPPRHLWAQVPQELLEETLRRFHGHSSAPFASFWSSGEPAYVPEHALFWALLSESSGEEDVRILLSLAARGRIDIPAALQAMYGGQAVGRGASFLLQYHVLPFYIYCNLIIACELQAHPDAWGLLRPDSPWREWLMRDCDFYTFIPSWRPLLAVLFQDLEATKELLKRCFRLLYLARLMEAWTQEGFDFQRPSSLRVGGDFEPPSLANLIPALQ